MNISVSGGYSGTLSKAIRVSLLILTLSACAKPTAAEMEQDAALNLMDPPSKHFQQWPGDKTHPAEFYSCGANQNPCKTNISVNRVVTQKCSQKRNSTKLIYKGSK